MACLKCLTLEHPTEGIKNFREELNGNKFIKKQFCNISINIFLSNLFGKYDIQKFWIEIYM